MEENTIEKNSLLDNDTESLGYGFQDYKYELFLRKEYDRLVDFIIIKSGRGGVWEVVDAILVFMNRHFPREIRDVVNDVKKDRELSYNRFGATKDMTLRKLGSVPPRLENLLFRAYDGNWPMPSKKFRREFFRRYPQFAVAQDLGHKAIYKSSSK